MKKNNKRRKGRAKAKTKPTAPPKAQPAPDPIKPKQVQPTLKGSVLLWVSAALLTLTLFGNLQAIVEMTAPARWLVANWERLIETTHLWPSADEREAMASGTAAFFRELEAAT